ncbi:CYTH domain-containing protein [Desulfonema limicola]|uniref:CYTH domain-containing protein n=1 Tax=Desulfonema limicola TaxID=45656 RepID=A0A975B7G1_9BACT|nr:CYTH domain-containing protein [Desulfonema limicola]QTA80257.1 CYTH domain-containing protein [Desulfonema limicola]
MLEKINKKGIEKKFVFKNDAAARYIFFALKNDLGGLGGYQMYFWESSILSDIYYDRADLSFSRKGIIHRYREEYEGDLPVFKMTMKDRKLTGTGYEFQKKEGEKQNGNAPEYFELEGENLQKVAAIRTYRMTIAVLTEQNWPIGLIHCDQSSALEPDGTVKKKFYEIELQYEQDSQVAKDMENFSVIIQKTFDLLPVNKTKLERALDI